MNAGIKKWQYVLFLAIVGIIGGLVVELAIYLIAGKGDISTRSLLTNGIVGGVIGVAIAVFGSKNIGQK